MYNSQVKINVSEARQRLPQLVRQIREDPDLRVQITVHGNVAAELRACPPEPSRGAAARRLKELMAELPEGTGAKHRVSEAVSEHLYGAEPE